jgi:putative acyl-CoA dehydrogenase
MTTLPRFDIGEVFNQSPPYENIDLFSSDAPLMEAVKGERRGRSARARGLRAAMGYGAEMFALARRANENPPKLIHFDPKGFRRDVVEFHPAYHDLMRASVAAGCMPRPGRRPASARRRRRKWRARRAIT